MNGSEGGRQCELSRTKKTFSDKAIAFHAHISIYTLS